MITRIGVIGLGMPLNGATIHTVRQAQRFEEAKIEINRATGISAELAGKLISECMMTTAMDMEQAVRKILRDGGPS